MRCCEHMTRELNPDGERAGFLFADDLGQLTILGPFGHSASINHCPWCGVEINATEVKDFFQRDLVCKY
jgi:hypothetical protein